MLTWANGFDRQCRQEIFPGLTDRGEVLNVVEIAMKTITPHRRQALAIALSAAYALGPQWAYANPDGAQVISGQAAIQAQGSQLNITNSAGAIINWRGFSIGAGETTRFIQPSAASAVLNRVVGPDMSQLLGQLQSNGQIYLINPNGIVVGASARIDTNSFIGSTLDITDADFLAGKLRFLERSGGGSIRNEGLITAGPGGRIALIAPNIENNGIIRAPDGNILLAAGRKLEIASLDLDGIRFEIQAPTDSVLNLGKLLAENGAVRAFAGTLRNSGEIEAKRMALDASGSIVLSGSNSVTLTRGSVTRADGANGGTVLIQSREGTTRVDGRVSAAGADGAGGDVRILGQRVALDAGAQVVVSGSTGGGQILVGGDYQGANADVQNAERVHVAAGATLQADATVNGDGGRVIVWSDENTRYYGDLSAKGGSQGGNGGFAEVSGKQNLEFAGGATLTAAAGKAGTLLLDPLDILVSLTSGILPSVVDEFSDFASNVVTVSPLTLAAVGGSVVLQAERDIYVRDALTLTASGASLTVNAGGALFNAGSIINTAGITTNAGAVTLRGQSISGAGGITTQGGAVDLMTSSALNYTGAIQSGGGSVTLASQNSSVNNANVEAGSGAIAVNARSISGGSYATTGTAGFTATNGAIYLYDVSAGVVNMDATSAISATVAAGERVNASSSGSYVQLSGDGSTPLRLGSITGTSGIYLSSYGGMEQAAGGLLTSRYVSLSAYGSVLASGSAAAPIRVAAPTAGGNVDLEMSGLAAPMHVALVGNAALERLSLDGTVAGLGGTTITGAGNFSTLTLGQSGAVLDTSMVASGGLANGLSLSVTDGGINAATMSLPAAPVSLSSAAGVTVGTMAGGSLSVDAQGAVNIGSASTTGSSGIYVSTQACSYYNYVACAATSPIVAGTLNAGGTGSINLSTYDNGNISVTNLTAGRDVYLRAGNVYSTSQGYPYTSQATNNNVQLGTVVAGRNVQIDHYAQGDIAITSLSAAGNVYMEAGTSYSPAYNVYQSTTNNITIGNSDPAGATGYFDIYNYGLGNISVSGVVDRSTSGSIELYAGQGSIVATGPLTARDSIYISASVESSVTGSATVGQLVAGAGGNNGNVTVEASGDVSFGSITASGQSGSYGNVSLNADSGFVHSTNDNTTADVVGTSNVSVFAGTSIGNAAFVNPLDIQAGTAASVTLHAGQDVGAVGKAVNVNTSGTLDVTSVGGQFHVAATDGSNPLSLSTIRLSASAAGIGNGNSATFTSLDLDVTAASNGTAITIGDLVRSAGTLNELRFDATGASGLNFGNVGLTTGGYNQLRLNASGPLVQSSGNINAGYVRLDGGGGAVTVGNVVSSTAGANSVGNSVDIYGADITTGNLSGLSVNLSGANLSLGTVTSTGTNRNYNSNYLFVPHLGYFQYVNDEMHLTASGSLTSGIISSATSAYVSAGNGVSVGGGSGTISGGHYNGSYYRDTVNVNAGSGTLATGAITARAVTIAGNTLNTGAVTADDSLSVSGTTFNTGNLTATNSSLTITATGAYAPGVVLTAGGSATITAPTGIDLVSGGASLSAPSVTLRASGGNINAALPATTSLVVETGGVFNITSGASLGNLNVTADGSVAGAGAGSAISGSGQSLTYVATGGALALQMASGTGLSNRYTETSSGITDIGIGTTGTFGGTSASSILVTAPVANIVANAVTMGGTSGNLSLSTAGNISLTSVTTGGASVNATSSAGTIDLTSVQTVGGFVSAQAAGDLNVERVVTLGAGVSLNSANGSIVRTGAQALQVDTRDGQGNASGSTTLTLSAANGSVGSAGTRLQTSGAVTLNVNAHDAIAIDVLNTALTNLSLTTSASGANAISVSDTNFASLGITRSGSDLLLGAVNPVSAGAFSLTATDGNIVVGGDIANVTTLGLNAGYNYGSSGNLVIQASGGPRSVSANSYDLRAGQDVLIGAGALAGQDVTVAQVGASGHDYVYAQRDIVVAANGGSATLAHNAAGWTQTLYAGRDILIDGGSAGLANAAGTVSSAGYQSLTAGRDLAVRGGSADQASAALTAVQSQSMSQVGGAVMVLGGGGLNAFAEIASSSSSQSLGASYSTTTDLIQVQGGAGNGAYASVRAATSQNIQGSGDIRVVGGSGPGANAEILAGSSQNIGSTSNYFNDPTAAILVQAGAGGTARIRAASTQTVLASESISVLGGTGVGMTAAIETTAGSQSIGSSGTSFNDPTANILVQGGSGDGAVAGIRATGTQTIQTGGSITVLGSSGVGAHAEILSSAGGQTIGATSTSSNDPTDSITVQAGSGGTARIQAQNNQTIRTGADLSVIGGSGTNMTASVQSMAGFQTIGSTSIFSNDPSGAILVQAGSGSGAAAFINAATGQTIDAGGTITVAGNAAGAYAEIVTSAGSQTIGNVGGSNDRTDSITLAGGSAGGSYARVAAAAGSQNLRTSANLVLTGGNGDNAGALLQSGTGQTLTVQGALRMVGGSGSAPGLNETAIRNTSSGTQSIFVSGDMSVTGGGFGADTWVKQNGTGNQNISVGGTLALLSPASTPSTGVTSIEALGPDQSISVGGAMTVVNQGGWLTYVAAAGTQAISADAIGISLSTASPVSSPFAGITATGNQSITLHGDGSTVGSATVSIFNTSSLTDSLAAISTAANQTILMDYNSAGLVQIGSTDGLGRTQIYAGGTHTLVAGQLLIQGGASAAATAALMSPNDAAVISTIYGPIQLRGGALGAALIDPPQLDMVSNNGVFLLAGTGSSASATINAGTFNLAATNGDLSLISSAAAAAIIANVFNYFGAGNVNLTGGTITVSQAGTITITGICYSCGTNLFGPFSISAYIPPPTDYGALVMAGLVSLSDLGVGLFEAYYNEDGQLELRNRRLNQCY
jgi:trimeric autotransporter adhesin